MDCISKLALASRPPTNSIVTSTSSANTKGRLEKVCGAMGTITKPPKAGCNRGPPADKE